MPSKIVKIAKKQWNAEEKMTRNAQPRVKLHKNGRFKLNNTDDSDEEKEDEEDAEILKNIDCQEQELMVAFLDSNRFF